MESYFRAVRRRVLCPTESRRIIKYIFLLCKAILFTKIYAMVRVPTNQLMMNILCVVRGDTNHGGVIPYFNSIGVPPKAGRL
jgi:hypothetical protein